jgi:hypothetical protein
MNVPGIGLPPPAAWHQSTLEHVFLGGTDILRMEEDGFGDDSGKPVHYTTLTRTEFETRLSEEMAVPAHLLKVTYDFKNSAKTSCEGCNRSILQREERVFCPVSEARRSQDLGT